MTLTPLINTDPVIQLHIASALLALLLGPIALYRARRDSLHRWTGSLWAGAMFTVALSSFWIHHFGVIGPFSPIHLLAVLTLWSLVDGMRHAFARRWEAHGLAMRALYWRGLAVVGLFTFLPGRVFNRIFFPELPELGYGVIALCGGAVFARALRTAPLRSLKRGQAA